MLRDLVRLYDAGMREPLPLPLKACLAWAAEAPAAPEVALHKAAGYKWTSGNYDGEDADPEQVQSGEPVRRWTRCSRRDRGRARSIDGETTRFGALALRVWSPMIERVRAEECSSRWRTST